MTTHELAKKLLEGPDVIATVRGYESGVYEVIDTSEPMTLCLEANGDTWYLGPHEYCNYPDCGHEKRVMAVHISGARK